MLNFILHRLNIHSVQRLVILFIVFICQNPFTTSAKSFHWPLTSRRCLNRQLISSHLGDFAKSETATERGQRAPTNKGAADVFDATGRPGPSIYRHRESG
ncbi:hypothetical protein CEXT_167351 [Caerostris extrusa]|uniref:Secreted protein n=1 Tax=Caerostris extrusa TaxID=172846 RepID=A0AAV4W7N3_CAEEX|nr:hypothetical protein CEXT_167351 [Caerostris extrusa]